MANRFNITDITINSLQLRNMTEERIYIQDIDKQGIFEYDAADVSTPHDGIYVLVDASGRRYKKVTASLVGLKIPAAELPGYVDDVLEYANFSAFPLVGVSGIIYIAADTGLSYRWSGSIYALVAGGVASVNGLSGIVTLYTDNINEGGSPVNLWYTEARVSANIDVAANTAARHAAMTISGGSSGFASLAGQVLTINQGGINYWVKATNDIYYSAGKVAIGTSTMAGALNILGNVGTNVGSNNFAWGGVDGALNNLNNNSNNIGIGSYAGRYANTASGNNGYNIILGFEAGYGQNGLSTYTNVNAIGYRAGYSLTTGTHNNLMGSEAGYSITTGSYINAFGQQAGRYNIPVSVGHNNLFGLQAGYGQNGLSTYTNVIAIGYRAGYSLTTGSNNFFAGNSAGYSLTTGSNNFFAGNSAGYSATSSSDNIYIGQQAGYHSTGSTNIVMGFGSGIGSIGLSTYTQCNLMGYYVGSSLTTGSHINAIGQEALRFNTTGSYINAFGTKAGYYLIPSGNAHNNLFGYQAGYGQNGASTYTNVNAIGADSCRNLTTSSFINAIGGATCFNTTTGSGINALGFSALYFNQTGSYINAIGHNAGYYNIPSSVAYNDLIGYQAGYGQEGLSTYTSVIAIGYRAGYSLTTGSSNVLVGTSAGYSLTTGSNNFLVCSSAGYAYTTSSYNVAIGSSASRYNNPASNGFNFIAGLEAGYGQSGLSTYTNVIAIGYRAGYSLTTGTRNIFIGTYAGGSATTVNYAVNMGHQAGYSNSTGDDGICIGRNAGYYETNGARLYITNQQGSNLADGIAKAIIYGEMGTTSSQILYLNAGTSIFANALGVTQSTTRGLILENSTAAAAGAQQYSPAIRWRGFGWKTDTTAASQAVDFRSFIVPVQGTSAPTGSLRFESAINGGSYSEIFSIDSLGFSKDIGRKRVGTQFDKTTNTTLGDVTNLSVTVGAGDTYKFKAHLFVNADATGGSKYAVGGTATATNIIYSIRLLDDSTDAYTIVSRQTAIGGNAGQVGTTEGTCIIEGSIVVNAGGTLTVQFAQNASNATSSVLVGSTFEVEKI